MIEGLKFIDLEDQDFGRVQLLLAIPRPDNNWGVLACLKGTVWEDYIDVVTGNSLSIAQHGMASYLMNELGSDPRGKARRFIASHDADTYFCRHRGNCIGFDPKACLPGAKTPDCFEANLKDHKKALIVGAVLRAWKDNRYVIVVEGKEFSL